MFRRSGCRFADKNMRQERIYGSGRAPPGTGASNALIIIAAVV
jgi:hypothetical protein